MIVVDCSILISSMLPDENNSFAEKVIEQLALNEIQAIAPAHFYLECSNVLLMAYRKKRINKQSWQDYRDAIALLPIEIDSFALQAENLSSLADFAEQHRLTIYDAAYLELAERLTTPLATLDIDLITAAKKIDLAYALRS